MCLKLCFRAQVSRRELAKRVLGIGLSVAAQRRAAACRFSNGSCDSGKKLALVLVEFFKRLLLEGYCSRAFIMGGLFLRYLLGQQLIFFAHDENVADWSV